MPPINEKDMSNLQCQINTEEINKSAKEMAELKTFVLGLNGKGGLLEDVKDMKSLLTDVKSSVDELSSRWIREISETHGRIDKVDSRLLKNEEEIDKLTTKVTELSSKFDSNTEEEVQELKDQINNNKAFWKGIGQNLLTEVIKYGVVFAVLGAFGFVFLKLIQVI